MPSPKKKLPTGPIRIDIPTQLPSDTSVEEVKEKIRENRKPDSTLLEDSLKDSTIKESIEQDTAKQESSLGRKSQESSKQESTLREYKKVAMRLSVEAAENLRKLRVETGIPYEILVDVMIRNWDNLPTRIRAAYLKQAKQVRSQRLMAGQEKTIQTMRKKYLEDR